jgi:hypothetical protein
LLTFSYGDLGRELIKTYLLELVDWGYLPLYEVETRYKPLGPKPYLARVLIPEVATMMIQSRLDYSPADDYNIEDESYSQAQKIRKKSMTYGRTAYGSMDSDLGSEIMLSWNRGVKHRKTEVEKIRGTKGSSSTEKRVKQAKPAIIDLSDDVGTEVDRGKKLKVSVEIKTRKPKPDKRHVPSSPLLITINDDEDELEDETVQPSQTSYKSSTQTHSQQTIMVPPTPSPPITKRQISPSSSIQTYVPQNQKRKRNRRSRSRSHGKRKRSSQPPTPSKSYPLSQTNSGTSLPSSSVYRNRTERRKAGREAKKIEKKNQAVEPLRLSMSQDSYGDAFDMISSQDLARLEADAVAA